MDDSFSLQSDVLTVLVLASVVSRFKDIDHDTPNEMILRGITDAALSESISVPVQFVNSKQAIGLSKSGNLPPAMRRGELSGVIIASEYSREILNSIGSLVPCVTIPRIDSVVRADSVGPEHILSMCQIVRHLVHLGHKKIGFVGMRERSTWVIDRFAGYLHGLNDERLEYDPKIVINMFGGRLDDEEMMKPIIDATSKNKATAWVCVSDGMAAQVYHAFADAGYGVPEDVSITGFDGIMGIAGCPALTTIAVPWQDIGVGALHAVLQRVKTPDSSISHSGYMGHLIEGETTAEP